MFQVMGRPAFEEPLEVFQESDRNSNFAIRDIFMAPEGALIEATLRADGEDRDFFELQGFAPGAPVIVEIEDTALDTVLGAFDAFGALFAVDDDGGARDLSRLLVRADEDGVIRIAVSGYADFDFDGEDDIIDGPHGESGDYLVRASPIPVIGVESENNDAFAQRNVFESLCGGAIAADLGPDGSDRDYFEFRGLIPGAEMIVEVIEGGFDSVLGAFDENGSLVATDDDGGEGLLSRLVMVADDDGSIRVAVSGYDDFDFNGEGDDFGGPHGAAGAYVLEASLVKDTFVFGQSGYVRGAPGLDYFAAKAQAEACGGRLLEVGSAAENAFIMETFWNDAPIRLGLTDRRSEGEFEWESGDHVGFTNWLPNNPNDAGGQDFAVIATADGQWDDQGGFARGGVLDESGAWRGRLPAETIIEFDLRGPDSLDFA